MHSTCTSESVPENVHKQHARIWNRDLLLYAHPSVLFLLPSVDAMPRFSFAVLLLPLFLLLCDQTWIQTDQSVSRMNCFLDLRSYVPHTKYKTPPNPKIHPEIHPNSPPKPKYRKNTKNIRKSPNFVFFLYFFCISVLEGDLGCISGCILGFGGVLYFVWGTYDRNPRYRYRLIFSELILILHCAPLYVML